MTMPDLGRLRWRLLAANLAVATAGIAAVIAGVWLAAPRAFEDAMGHMGGDGAGSMMGGSGGMMDPLLRSAFGEAVGSALLLGLVAAVVVAVIVALLLATGISRPIDDLAAASERVARGDYTRPVPAAPGELGDLAAAFNGMAASLEASEQRRRDLVGDVAHELRTPITSVRGYVEGLAAGVFEPGPDTWRVLDEQTARLEHLVDDLALLWRAESRDLRLDIGAIDGPALLADARQRHQAVAVQRSVDLSLGAPVDGTAVMLSVRDDGPGLTPDQAARVFERFYRADPSRSRDAGGSGLGLAITSSLVEAMGGTITVASEGPGRGAAFTVRLPRT